MSPRPGRTLAVALFAAASGLGAPALAASAVVNVYAKATKPLSLSRVQDLSFGTIVLAPGTWNGASVAISQAGVLRCTDPHTTCSGAPLAAGYAVSGSNNQVVYITAPNVVMTNQSDPTQSLILVVDSPSSVTLNNGGSKGTAFAIGGTITLSSSTAGGTYAGTFNVTVDY